MISVTQELAKNAVNLFLISQFNKKTNKEQKQLDKAREDEDFNRIAELENELAEAKTKFQKEGYLDYLVGIAAQLKFGTHISKGIHPDSKGDNITFINNRELPSNILGTHSINSKNIDANGNAAALPFAAFVCFELDDNTTIADLILTDNQDFIASLSDNSQKAVDYQKTFKEVLQNDNEIPVSHERNKQILWPVNSELAATIDDIEYKILVPLYPSVLTYENFQRINELRYSEENKQARDNRFKKTGEQKQYVSLANLATLQLGGTKPQNISMLMSKQRGCNYLLPSMPPILEHSQQISLSKFVESIFDSRNFKYRCKKDIQVIFKIIKSERNNVNIRKLRGEAIDKILRVLFSFAKTIQTDWQAGWSRDYVNLRESEKYWLDPGRADLDGENAFKENRESMEWNKDIISYFANWLNDLLKSEFKDIKHEFASSHYKEWESEIEQMQKQYERAGMGVFL